MKKVVFLDRDGVVNKEIGDYIYDLSKFKINHGFAEAIKKWAALNYSFAIVTNQGGISKSIYTKKDLQHIHNYLISWFQKIGADLLTIQYCPHHNLIESCICRKPNSLMLEKIIARYQVSIKSSFMIGDSQRDIEAARRVGLKGILIEANSDLNKLNLF